MKQINRIRVRFAPSPTGALHIGGARTALFNWLYARKSGGIFILRLEDTDSERSSQESARGILDGLAWLGLDWDEGPDRGGPYGPYRQSQRLTIYHQYLKALLDANQAYYCFCSNEDIAADKALAREQGRDYKYSGRCRHLDGEAAAQRVENGQPAVIRLRVPNTGITKVSDLIRGEVEFDNSLMDDFIIAKSDGWPTYNFAVVVDDHMMAVSHVIRAEEHLSNTPRQILIYQALNWELPQFAHVSMILAPDRSKLSKRHGATSVQEFRELGYLPQALLNYLALLGWSSGTDQDIWDVNDIVPRFDLEHVSRSAAVYDIEKLTWMNGHYISQARPESLATEMLRSTRVKHWMSSSSMAYLIEVVKLVQGRAKLIPELIEAAAYFFEEVNGYEEKGVNKHFARSDADKLLQADLEILTADTRFTLASLESALREKAAQMGVKAADLIHPLRLALTGRTNSPGIFEVAVLLGREKCLKRINQAIKWLDENRLGQ
jgi:glutamyl-tRNA synthetase